MGRMETGTGTGTGDWRDELEASIELSPILHVVNQRIAWGLTGARPGVSLQDQMLSLLLHRIIVLVANNNNNNMLQSSMSSSMLWGP